MKIINKALWPVVVAMACVAPSAMAQQTEQQPIVTFHTNIYDTYGDTNSFHIVLGTTEETYFDIDYGFGPEEVAVSPAYYDSEAQAIVGTGVQMRVNSDGIVRIYGDASKLDYFDAEGCYISDISMDECTNLDVLNLSHNELKALDLTPFTKLSACYLTDNTFSAETPLIVGAYKPFLQILEIDIIDYIDESFNMSDYPELVFLTAYHNRGLKRLDPTGCPNLQSLSLDLTDVGSLDVSKNPELIRLNIGDTRITEIDLTKNTKLQQLFASYRSGSINTQYKLSEIDLTNNPGLTIVDLGGNNISEIDLSNNRLITNLTLTANKLTHINLDANTRLYSVNLSNNFLNFATLPLPKATWGEYYYFRTPLACNKSYPVDTEIDFSSEVLRDGGVTYARVWSAPTAADTALVDESLYTYVDGKISFHQALADSVYVEFANTLFPDYTLSSGRFMVKTPEDFNKPSKILAFTPSATTTGGLSFGVAVDGASATTPKTIHVYVNSADEQTFTVNSSDPTAPSLITMPDVAARQEVAVYIEEDDVLCGFAIDNVALTSIDVSAAPELRALSVTDCNLRTISLVNNRCLTSLDLSGNRLGSLSLAADFGSYEKNVLKTIKAERNSIYNFEIVATTQVETLDLSDNILTSIELKNFDGLKTLDLSGNRLTEVLNLAYLSEAVDIDIHSNSIDSLTLVDMPLLRHLDVSDNKLSIRTLPVPSVFPSTCDYVYAPLKDLEIVDKAPGVNISAQYRVIDGNATQFKWYKQDGTPLVEGTEVVCTDGATRFLDENLGEVYCKMTHASFPALSGDDVYKTTSTLVVGAPTTVICSFTTPEATDKAEVIFRASKNTAVYIDWRGDGTEYIQYEVPSANYLSYPGQVTYVGANAKVYTYGEADELTVFSLYDAGATEIDASPMTGLMSFSAGGNKVDENTLKLPATADLQELNLRDNNFSTKTFEEYHNLLNLILSGNRYTTFDAGKLPNLQVLSISDNELTDISFNNGNLWGLDISRNNFKTIAFDGARSLNQIMASGNAMESIDLSAIKDNLRVLDISNNSFRFNTLPLAADFPGLTVYYYSNQSKLDAESDNGVVDLSSQASVAGVATTYTWYLGEVYIDEETGEWVGQALSTDTDDADYTVSGGVTTFNHTFDEPVTCVMLNDVFPNLVLYTNPVTVDKAGGIGDVYVDGAGALDADAIVDVYTVYGVEIRHAARLGDVVNELPRGFYIIGGQKVFINR